MDYWDRIYVDPNIKLGKPVIKNTRITVELVLKKLGEGMNIDDIVQAYPNLKKEDVIAAIKYSADVVGREEMLVS